MILNSINIQRQWALLGVVLVICAVLADWLFMLTPCTLCVLQRYVLIVAAVLALHPVLSRGINYVFGLGILLGLRHVYVLLNPVTTSCLPISMIMDVPLVHWFDFLFAWLGSLGHSCGQDNPMLDGVLVALLLAYYVFGVLLSRYVMTGALSNERISGN